MGFAVRAVLLVLVTGAAEIVLFIVAARWIGVAWTLGLALAVSVFGAWLLRREGVRGWRRFRAALAEHRPPGVEVSDGLVGLAAAVLLVVPGFLTGVVGLLLLLPPVRALARASIRRGAERRIPSTAAGDLFGPRRVRTQAPTQAAPDPGASVLEGEIVDPDRR